MSLAVLSPQQRAARSIAAASWLALLLLVVLWEWLLAPLRPGGSWLVLKGVPLLLPLRGVLRGDVKVMQWALLLVLAYIAEGSVRAVDAPPAGTLAMIEIALGLAFFAAAIVYLRPFKKAARRRAGG
ncbi:MAG: DUF2069 domain-containing protein [Burkholderiales bacterium]|jgi:uncharacterized membrane protein|nr:DUF2069 domain-containing protein [Burkholderiales bacterium]